MHYVKCHIDTHINMTNKKIYFISDFHLGIPDREKSLLREQKIVQWLEMIKKDVAELYLMGDIFDFWFEYKHVVPKGYVRLLGKLAEFTDAGIPVHLFTGNHDMWTFDYLQKELNIKVHHKPATVSFADKKFYLAHGDGLGPGDYGYKFIKKVFRNPVCQWLFARIHPNSAIGIAKFWSGRSRLANGPRDEKYLGDENEWLVIYSKKILEKEHFDYFIYGHRHLPLDIKLNNTSRYINLGDWVNYFSYAEFDGTELTLKYF